jgi:predicted nucleotidyltransferase
MGIKERIANGLKKLPVKVRSAAIYGSWAKGTQKEDSDIDILMISDEVNPRKQKLLLSRNSFQYMFHWIYCY